MEHQWLESVPPSSWSQYGARITTNNDVEGWHRSFNVLVGSRPSLYSFVEAISAEARKNHDIIGAEDFLRRRATPTMMRGERIQAIRERLFRNEVHPGEALDEISAVCGYLTFSEK